MMLASNAELASAAMVYNAAFAHTQIAVGCKIELGIQLVLTGLTELPSRLRGSVLSAVLMRLCGRFAPPARAPREDVASLALLAIPQARTPDATLH